MSNIYQLHPFLKGLPPKQPEGFGCFVCPNFISFERHQKENILLLFMKKIHSGLPTFLPAAASANFADKTRQLVGISCIL
jgi:hypothetical protein